MRRLRYFFICILLCIAFPAWRALDFTAFLIPSKGLFSGLFSLFSLIFILWPYKIAKPGIPARWILLTLPLFMGIAYVSGPLSSMATREPGHGHCGKATYTGLLYPIRSFLSYAYQDDLELRNQLCWVRKMISKVPGHFDSVIEGETYLKLTKEKLLRPENKYRAVLPAVLILWGKILYPMNRFAGTRHFISGLELWSSEYSIEISQREYQWYDWPYSAYIQFEYGIIEKNWDKIRIELEE